MNLNHQPQTQGSIGCPGCGTWVSVKTEYCPECHYWQPGAWGFHRSIKSLGASDFGRLFTILCSVLMALSLLADFQGISFRPNFNFLSPSSKGLLLLGACGSYPVFDLHHWWTLLSCPFLHGGLFHIGFNLVWIFYLAPVLIDAYGFFRLFLIFTISAVLAGLLSAWAGIYFFLGPLQGAQLSIGASGGVFGLFGAMIYYGQSSGRKAILQFAIQNALISLLGAIFIARVDNWAHIGGLLFGYLLPQTVYFSWKTRPDNTHLLFTLGLLLAILVSVFYTYISTLPVLEGYGSTR